MYIKVRRVNCNLKISMTSISLKNATKINAKINWNMTQVHNVYFKCNELIIREDKIKNCKKKNRKFLARHCAFHNI